MRRTLATFAALGLAFSLTACGDDKAATEAATPQVVASEQTAMDGEETHEHTEGDGHDHADDKGDGDKMAADIDASKMTCDDLAKITDADKMEATYLALTKAAGKSPEDDNDILDVSTKVTEFCAQPDNLGKPIVENLK
ncbi:hypothetical protein EII12_04060 [Buchananella hordeovulneris]|uniref:LptM family lipoprotein n=1 Tax=Buchananella hordeovulneris TaxID=52770 RepID=UPI000F5FC9E2|nr:hypothetical protein [Buchananella hordeovulneris]RRD52756.1 hypothetical protein EII12_04060 [Buchananella hordeovulneris]